MRRKIVEVFVCVPWILSAVFLGYGSTSVAHALPLPATDCHTPVPTATSFPSLFQKEVDATQHFTLQVRRLVSPANWYVQLGYLFIGDDGTLAIDPTLLAVPGSDVGFQFVNCLSGNDIVWLRQYDALQPPPDYTPVDVDGFTVDTAMVMTPSGYGNIHAHGLHSPPVQGDMMKPAGDEVLYTVTSPELSLLGQPGVGQTQAYDIHIPANQDPGLYWYHPHLHGEAQPQVFLGMSGAILVLPGKSINAQQLIEAEIAAHPDPVSHPAVFVIRDYPAPPPQPPSASDTVQPAATASSVAPTRAQALGLDDTRAGSSILTTRRHRANFLNHTRGSSTAAGTAKTAQTLSRTGHPSAPVSPPFTSENPRCALFQAPAGTGPCLPDAVSTDPTLPPPDAPALATLITVNGQITEALGQNADGAAQLLFTPIAPAIVDDTLRVANASANTYVKLSLSPATLPSLVLSSASVTVMPMVPLHQLHRDGAPVPQSSQTVNTILLPPGGRAEFSSAASPVSPLSLVSQYFNTGPAGDLVPPRTLASLPSSSTHVLPILSTTATSDHSLRFSHTYDAPKVTDVRRAFAFFEQDRPCSSNDGACGTSFYLLDITAPVFGSGISHLPLKEARPFAIPMLSLNTTNPPSEVPTRGSFQGPNGSGLFNPVVPSVQVVLRGQEEVEEEWDIYNFTAEAHAFHIHQLSFRVGVACSAAFRQAMQLSPDCRGNVGTSGDENHETDLVLDVVNIPPAISIPNGNDPTQNLVYPSRVHLRMPFHKDIAGNFVMHCHLLEHEDNGMMLGIQVWPGDIPSQTAPISEPATQHQTHPSMPMP